MKKIAVISLGLAMVFCLVIGYADAQNISDEAMRHFGRGQAAVEMAKTSADYKPAIKEFEEAARLVPDWPDVYYNLGLIQNKIGRYDNAIRNLKKYLELSPNANDIREVKKFIAKIEYKMEKEEGIKKVYKIMTSVDYNDREATWGDYKRLIGNPPVESNSYTIANNMLDIFRMVSGKMQVFNWWYVNEKKHGGYHSKLHPPILREWEPVKVNGRFYEYTYSYYMDVARGYVVRYDNEVKGEIVSLDPPRVKETAKFSIPWGAPISGDRQSKGRPWLSNNNFGGMVERMVEWRRK